MTQLIVDGFSHYGNDNIGTSSDDMISNMQAGAYANVDMPGVGNWGIGNLPWDPTNTDLYIYKWFLTGTDGPRRVLPTTATTAFFSFYFAVDQLPASNNRCRIIDFRDGSNYTIGYLCLDSTGIVSFRNAAGTVLSQTAGPVIVAQTATHMEMKIVPGASADGTFVLKVNETQVINATALTMSYAGPLAQYSFGGANATDNPWGYYSHFIVRDDAGTLNNDFAGDRRVATLLVDQDDGAHQGWTKRPLQKFGNGILDLTSDTTGKSCVYADASAETDLGSVDFTMEGFFRFQLLPTGSNKAVLFGKWSETDNNRSYQLYKAGPSLNNGELCWQKSTDGGAGTASLDFHMPWDPELGRWYHVAVERVSGNTSVYIDGVLLGTAWADSAAYYNGTGHLSVGCELYNVTAQADKGMVGWQDEFRFTKGSYRYGAPFTPPSTAFPRGSGSDAQWSDVYWLSGWDSASIADESGFSRVLTGLNSAAAITPGDGVDGTDNYLVLNKTAPDDDTYIEAALIAATGTLTTTANPSATETVTVGTTDGSTPAVYTFVNTLASAFDVLIGADQDATLTNLMNAIIAGTGAGTTYGTGTTANYDVTATKPSGSHQVLVTALTPGTSGNSIASTETLASGSWGGATLSGGLDIPAYSQFSFQNLPAGASVVDSLTLIRRSWKSDAGTETSQATLVGGSGGTIAGASVNDTTVPILYHDMFENDPDTPANPLTPTAANAALFKIDRTA